MRIKAVIFDLGNTLAWEIPEYQGRGEPMAHWPHVELMPGAKEAIEISSKHYRLCVAANSDYAVEWTEETLKRLEIRNYFECVVNSFQLGVAKPSPQFYRELLKCLAHTHASECVMVGDDYENDVLAAKDVGLNAIWLCASTHRPEIVMADAVINSLYELPDAIRQLDNRS